MSSVAIVGSRFYPDLEAVREYVHALPKDTVVISGHAPGVDQEAEYAAMEVGLCVKSFHADWHKHGKAAGPIRNSVLVKEADRVVAFYDGKSAGTLDTITKARAAGKECLVITCRRAPQGARKWDGKTPQRPRYRPEQMQPQRSTYKPPELGPDVAWFEEVQPTQWRRRPK